MTATLDFISSDVLQALAWIFTVLSAVASIALTIHKFGLSPAKRVALIVGVIIAGLVIVVFVLGTGGIGFNKEDQIVNNSVGGVEFKEVLALLKDDPRFGGIEFNADGSYKVIYVSQPVQRAPGTELIAVEVPQEGTTEAKKILAYNGTAIETEISGRQQTLDISAMPSGEVIVSTDDTVEIINPDEKQEVGQVRAQRYALD